MEKLPGVVVPMMARGTLCVIDWTKLEHVVILVRRDDADDAWRSFAVVDVARTWCDARIRRDRRAGALRR